MQAGRLLRQEERQPDALRLHKQSTLDALQEGPVDVLRGWHDPLGRLPYAEE